MEKARPKKKRKIEKLGDFDIFRKKKKFIPNYCKVDRKCQLYLDRKVIF